METQALGSQGSAPGSSWQFGLRHLFGLTTLAGIATALAMYVGPGTLMTSVGITAAWVNWCGLFRRWQAGRVQMALLVAAWLAFMISLCLPSLVVFGVVSGWRAAWIVFQAPLRHVAAWDVLHVGLLWYLLLDAANILMLLLPVLIWRLSRGGGQRLSAALCVSMVSTWVVVWDTPMLMGYYVWCACFLLVLVVVHVHGWTLLSMIVLAIFLGIAAEH